MPEAITHSINSVLFLGLFESLSLVITTVQTSVDSFPDPVSSFAAQTPSQHPFVFFSPIRLSFTSSCQVHPYRRGNIFHSNGHRRTQPAQPISLQTLSPLLPDSALSSLHSHSPINTHSGFKVLPCLDPPPADSSSLTSSSLFPTRFQRGLLALRADPSPGLALPWLLSTLDNISVRRLTDT